MTRQLEASAWLARDFSTGVQDLAQDTLELCAVLGLHDDAKQFERGMKALGFGQVEVQR